MRRFLFPKLDPPDGPTLFVRKLTRDRTDGLDDTTPPSQYVTTVPHDVPLRSALRDAGYIRNLTSTLKFVRDGGICWEDGTMALGLFDRGGENQHHAYWFRGRRGYHLHHHREWPVVNPRKHLNGSRTSGDPENKLLDALAAADIPHERLSRPEYETQ